MCLLVPAAFLGGSRGLAAVVCYTADFDIDQITNKWRAGVADTITDTFYS